eukprot:scaffold203_cov98-Skeletonema_dohrnii-CCMP3373.AAC.6
MTGQGTEGADVISQHIILIAYYGDQFTTNQRDVTARANDKIERYMRAAWLAWCRQFKMKREEEY